MPGAVMALLGVSLLSPQPMRLRHVMANMHWLFLENVIIWLPSLL